MNLQELYSQVMADQLPAYDERLAVAMSMAQYDAYQYNIGHTYYHFLSKLVRRLQPKRVLELGTSIGRSALFMMVTLPENSKLATIDIGSYLRTDLAPFAWDKRLKVIYGDDRLPNVAAEAIEFLDGGIDLLYMDSEHTYDQVAAEWEIYQLHLNNGAIVVMDDIHLNDGLIKFWEEIKYEKIATDEKLHFSGFGLFRYQR